MIICYSSCRKLIQPGLLQVGDGARARKSHLDGVGGVSRWGMRTDAPSDAPVPPKQAGPLTAGTPATVEVKASSASPPGQV